MTAYSDGYNLAERIAADIKPNSRMLRDCEEQLQTARNMLVAYRRAGHREYHDCFQCRRQYHIIGYCEGLMRARDR